MLYLHIGMHKTATSFLQTKVFPRLRGIEYIPQTVPLDAFLRLDSNRKYLISNERLAGTLWGSRDEIVLTLKRLSELFPDAKIIIGFRPHKGFIVSTYKQFLHRGGTLRFREYFDVETNTGYVKRDHFLYRLRLDAALEFFKRPPFVILYDEVKHNLPGLLKDLAKFLGAEAPSIESIDMRPVNRGVRYHPAKLLRWLNVYNRSELNPAARFRLDNKVTVALKIDPRRICQYWLAFAPDRDFLSPGEGSKIKAFYEEDWAYVERWREMREAVISGAESQQGYPLL